jgi:hypothetical protein
MCLSHNRFEKNDDYPGNPMGCRAVVGQIPSWTAYRGGFGVHVAEEYWTGTGDTSEAFDVALGEASENGRHLAAELVERQFDEHRATSRPHRIIGLASHALGCR